MRPRGLPSGAIDEGNAGKLHHLDLFPVGPAKLKADGFDIGHLLSK